MSKKFQKPRKRFPDSRRIATKEELKGVDINQLAASISYEPASYHKKAPFNNVQPSYSPKMDKSPCPIHLSHPDVLDWLKKAVELKAISFTSDGKYPKRIWYKDGKQVYEAHHSGQGKYHGYPVQKAPSNIDKYYK